jgi:LPS O-antigen subunit length determinant protein (WzzB/FepE family)
MNQKIEINDEIDLRILFLILWRSKAYIILLIFVSVFSASTYIQSAEKEYTVEYYLKPVGEIKNNSTFNGLGGFASMAGIRLPTSSNNDFNIFRELIVSTEVSEIIFKDNKIIKDTFKSEWNESLNNYSWPAKSKIQSLVSDFKKLLIGDKAVNYMPPSPKRLANFIAENIQITEDTESGFLRLMSETSEPKLMLSLIIKATESSDNIMRQRYVDFSTEPLAFYKEKLRTARSREHREALAELIGEEEQKLMFASRGRYFIAEPYINPTISLYPTSPKPTLILVFSLIFGFFMGSAIILIWNAIKREN